MWAQNRFFIGNANNIHLLMLLTVLVKHYTDDMSKRSKNDYLYVEGVPLITVNKKKLMSFKHHCSHRMRGFHCLIQGMTIFIYSQPLKVITFKGLIFFPSRCMVVLQPHSFRSLPKIKGQGYAVNNNRGKKCSKQMMISERIMAPVLLLLNVSTSTDKVLWFKFSFDAKFSFVVYSLP